MNEDFVNQAFRAVQDYSAARKKLERHVYKHGTGREFSSLLQDVVNAREKLRELTMKWLEAELPVDTWLDAEGGQVILKKHIERNGEPSFVLIINPDRGRGYGGSERVRTPH